MLPRPTEDLFIILTGRKHRSSRIGLIKNQLQTMIDGVCGLKFRAGYDGLLLTSFLGEKGWVPFPEKS